MFINRKKFDFVLFGLFLLLIIVGCIVIFSASTTVIGKQIHLQNSWWKQILFAFLALGVITLLLRLPMPVFDLLVVPLYILNILALILVFFTPAERSSPVVSFRRHQLSTLGKR